jgi:thiol:disulfide interchange protein DsbD
VWEKYHAGILEEARASVQPVILDFYADWCIPFHELDQFTYSDPKVIAALKNFRRIKVDATSVDTDEIREAVRRFDVYGVPTVIFIDRKGGEVKVLRMNGFVPPEEFVSAVRASGLGNVAGNGDPTEARHKVP